MQERLEQYLFTEFAQFFPESKNRIPLKSCMAFGFEVEDGWFHLVHTLLRELRTLEKMFPDHFAGFQVAQVKEKFGGLRFYWHGDLIDETVRLEVMGLIELAEENSFHICEDCGLPGTLRKERLWWRTLCDKCSIADLDPELKKKQREQGFERYQRLRKEWEKNGQPPL